MERNQGPRQKDELFGLTPAAKADFEALCKAHDEWEDGKDRRIAKLEAALRAIAPQLKCTCPTTAHGTPILSATCVACEARKALRELEGADRGIAELEADLTAAWSHIESAYDIEPRAYFEEKYRNSGATPLQMAIHYIWKRDPKVAAARQQAAREAVDAAEEHASVMRDRAALANEYGQGRADLDAKADAAMEIARKLRKHFGLEGK
jgi:hypothetical protein